MRKIEDEEKRWTTPGGGQCVGKPPPLPASNSLSADQLSLGHPHLVEASFVEMITDSGNWCRNLNNSNSSFRPQPPPTTTLLSSPLFLHPPLFSLDLLLFFSGSYDDNTEMNCRPRLQSSSSSPRLHQLLHFSGGAPNIDGEKETHRRAKKQIATTMRTATAAAKVMPTICAIDKPV